jgi:hypothetical protein
MVAMKEPLRSNRTALVVGALCLLLAALVWLAH